MLENTHDSDSLGTTQDQKQHILALIPIKSIKSEEDLTILQHISHKQPQFNGRRYFGGDRLEFLFQNSSIVMNTPQPSKRGRRNVGRPKKNRTDFPSLTKSMPRWRLVKSLSEHKHRLRGDSTREQAAQSFKPRIWASTQSELYDIFPGISKSVDGVSWENSETPFLVLEDSAWPEDGWSDNTTFRFSLIRDFTCDNSELESPLMNITPLEGFQRHYDSTDINPPALFFARNGYTSKQFERTDSTSTCVLCGDCSFINSVEYYEDLSAMQLPIVSSSTLANNDSQGNKIGERDVITSKPSLELSSPAQYRSTHATFHQDCEICGVDAGTAPAAIRAQVSFVPSQIKTTSNVPLWSRKIDSTGHCSIAVNHPVSNMRNGLQDIVSDRHLANGNRSTNDLNNRPTQRLLDRRIPTSYPPEIQALVDAHKSGMPIAIVSARDSPLSPVTLPREFGYSFLGFFFVVDIQVERIDLPTSGLLIKDQENGRIRWKLWFHWTPGGEDFLPDGENLTTPWWAPASLLPPTQSTPYMDRKDLLRNCHSLLPLSVLSGPGPYAASGLFPRGWYCVTCGKLNKQVFLRHRQCTSSFCQKLIGETKQNIIGYAEQLEHSRDHTQTSVFPFPADIVPQTVSSLLSTWTDSMHTYCYSIHDNIIVKHIFTTNLVSLQEEANVLFRDIQLHVVLRRQPKGPGYFSHLVGAGGTQNAGAMTWQQVPSCLRQARDLMIHQGRTYGETKDCSVNQLSILAWITTGRSKGPVIHARTSVVTILCLGADAVLSLTPKSGFAHQEASGSTLPKDAEMFVDSSTLSRCQENHEPMAPPGAVATSNGDMQTLSYKSKDVLVVTMVHGDVLVLIGDNFEVYFKRTGTTMLLIGENVPLVDNKELDN